MTKKSPIFDRPWENIHYFLLLGLYGGGKKKSQKSPKKKVLFGKVLLLLSRSVRCMEPVLVSLSGQKSGPEEV